jgi:hypothetical protein
MQIVVQIQSKSQSKFFFFPCFSKVSCFFYIQTFFYTIMNLFISLLENVNKSRTSASNVSLTLKKKKKLCCIYSRICPYGHLP